MTSPLSAPELQHILSLTENGTDDIISTRSKIFQKLNLDVESLSISELLRLIEENPSLYVARLFWKTSECKLDLTKTKSVHFCLVVIVNKNCAMQL